jgi:predicted ATPase
VDDAVRLFRARAEAAGGAVPDDPRAAELCTRLEGMALAIELAAARYPGLGLDGLAAGLGDPLGLLGSDEGARQRSLRATISWSVDLLDDEARAVFAAICVFAAPFTVAAAHAVAIPHRTLADGAVEMRHRHARWANAQLTSLASSDRDDAWCARFDQLAV